MDINKLSDTDLLDFLETCEGAALVSDDAGNWAVSGAGIQDVPDNPPQDILTSFFIEKDQWRPSVREAILAYKAREG